MEAEHFNPSKFEIADPTSACSGLTRATKRFRSRGKAHPSEFAHLQNVVMSENPGKRKRQKRKASLLNALESVNDQEKMRGGKNQQKQLLRVDDELRIRLLEVARGIILTTECTEATARPPPRWKQRSDSQPRSFRVDTVLLCLVAAVSAATAARG